MNPISIIILAAGKGKRMGTQKPKVLHALAGKSLLERVVDTSKTLFPQKTYVIYGNGGDTVKQTLSDSLQVEWVEQKQQLGTGHAVQQALPFIADDQRILVLYGDVPLISTPTLQNLLSQAPETGLAVLTAEFEDSTGFGRIIRDANGQMVSIIEHRDATPEQLNIHEINTGIMTAPAKLLKQWLSQIKNNNSQGEYYLTDVIALAAQEKMPVVGIKARCPKEVQGVNSLKELAELERAYQRREAHRLMEQGVRIMDPERFDIRGELEAAPDSEIDMNVIIEGKVKLGAYARIGAHCIIRDTVIADHVTIKPFSVIEGATIESGCVIGPFARIRPDTHLKNNTHIGNFVEVKKSTLGPNTKANHLSYLGDATVGANVNIGAGTITANYDGAHKHPTIIEDNVFIGSDSQLIAPVKVGEGATVAAGSTITKEVPPKQLAIARSRQTHINGWKRPVKKPD